MQWLDDIKTQFVTNFTTDIVCHFADGDIYRNMSTGAVVADQPTGTEWLRFTVVPGSTFNLSVGTVGSILKSQPFNIIVTVFVPRNRPFGAPNGATALEGLIDSAMTFSEINTAENGCIIPDSATPKLSDTFYAADGEIWNRVNLTYQYLYRYV